MTIRLKKNIGDYIVSMTLVAGMMVVVLGIATVLSLGQSMLNRGHAAAAAVQPAAIPISAPLPANAEAV